MSYVPIVTEGISPQANGSRISAGKTARILLPSARQENFSILVHSHLCWDWVWQRPQQFLSRLSARHRILFVETVGPDPQLAAPYAWFRSADGFPNITILRVQFPARQWEDGDFVDRERRRLVQQALRSELVAGQFENPVQ